MSKKTHIFLVVSVESLSDDSLEISIPTIQESRKPAKWPDWLWIVLHRSGGRERGILYFATDSA
jgi:hypothetical protein